mmetsp:Transcript_35764/g.83168  ORF Transcript_35764/g.83168 Transcript_35764/m.83168 type:complete len:267 (-) Transcript_35764:85-885(-)
MASEEKGKGPPSSLDALFKSKAKKKPKPVNLNAVTERPPPAKPAPVPKLLAHSSGGTSDGAEQGWERALRRDQELLKACDLWIKEVEADGACLFRAFADQLNGDGGEAHAQFRERCVDFMRDHREDFEPFLEEDFNEYCKRMREPTTWGGHVEAQALARLAGVNAIIYRPAEAGGQPTGLLNTLVEIPTSDSSEARCVQLSFHPTHHAGQHYNSVRCASDDGAGPAPPASLAELRRRTEEALRPKAPEPAEQAEVGGGKVKKKVFF